MKKLFRLWLSNLSEVWDESNKAIIAAVCLVAGFVVNTAARSFDFTTTTSFLVGCIAGTVAVGIYFAVVAFCRTISKQYNCCVCGWEGPKREMLQRNWRIGDDFFGFNFLHDYHCPRCNTPVLKEYLYSWGSATKFVNTRHVKRR